MRRYGFALLVAAAAAVGSTGAASAATPYDGRWSVVIQTTRGNCDQAYRYGLSIVNGNVTYDGGGGFDVRGRVAGNGAVRVRVSFGPQLCGRQRAPVARDRLGRLERRRQRRVLRALVRREAVKPSDL